MRKSTLFNAIQGGYIGFMLSFMGFGLTTWEFWAIMIPMAFLTQLVWLATLHEHEE